MGGRHGEKEVLLLFIKLYDSVQSCVYLLERLQHGCSVPFILGLFDLRMINTINYILRDLVGSSPCCISPLIIGELSGKLMRCMRSCTPCVQLSLYVIIF